MMQTILCSLIILAAGFYLASRWLPHQLKQHLLRRFGISTAATKPLSNSCGACSSCGSCSGSPNKPTQSAKK